tara:strand:- start:3937 stop:4209 length:273 start_codon:yes stop_codon:yes gene_type:complete
MVYPYQQYPDDWFAIRGRDTDLHAIRNRNGWFEVSVYDALGDYVCKALGNTAEDACSNAKRIIDSVNYATSALFPVEEPEVDWLTPKEDC